MTPASIAFADKARQDKTRQGPRNPRCVYIPVDFGAQTTFGLGIPRVRLFYAMDPHSRGVEPPPRSV